jgi:protein-tyrosine-phosphatase
MAHLVLLCTGNAARSVMAGAVMRAHLGDVDVTTAGTHVVEGMPMSWRTRSAIQGLEVDVPRHRSRQLRDGDVGSADLVVGLAGEHVAYVRRTYPDAAARTATLRRLARDLSAGPEPLGERVAALGLGAVELEPWEDVVDPAGGELPEFEACARDIYELLIHLAPALRESRSDRRSAPSERPH